MLSLRSLLHRPSAPDVAMAAIIVASFASDCLYLGEFQARPLAIRVLWAMLLLGSRTLSALTRYRLTAAEFTAVGTALTYGLLLWSMGSLLSPHGSVLAAMPVAIALWVGAEVRASVLGAVTNTLVVVALWWLQPDLAVGSSLVSSALFTGTLAIYGSGVLKRAAREQAQAQQSRELALEQLAESERQRGEVERLAVIGRLAAEVSHEINNPLAYVKSNIGVLKEETFEGRTLDDQELRSLFSETMVGVDRIQQIVADMKALCRRDHEELVESCAPGAFLDEALRMARVRLHSSITVIREVAEVLPVVKVDRRRMTQVFLNLLVNAAEALDAQSGPRRIVLRATTDGKVLRLSVEDNGPGIPPEILPRLFEAFTTSKREGKGLGLGLHLSRESVQQVGGELVAANLPSGGAAFTVVLPLTGEAAHLKPVRDTPPAKRQTTPDYRTIPTPPPRQIFAHGK